MGKSKLSRREFIRFAGITGGAALLTACAPQVVTQVVRETQIVEQTQIVSQTEVVEVDVPVTVTPPPAVVTPQGKVMPPDAAPLEMQISLGETAQEPIFLDGSRDIYRAGGLNAITEPLLRNNQDIELVPALAESWRVDDTGKLWEFTIREGAVWSDGTPITADDIVWTYEHAGDPALGNQWIGFLFSIKGLADYATGNGPASAIGVKKVDDRTVTYEGQNGFVPYLPQLLAYQAAVFAPKHVAEQDPEHWADTPEGAISSGPYVCSKWDHGKSIEFVINPLYNGPHKPYFQVIRQTLFPVGGTAPNALNQFLAQEVDLLHLLDAPSLAAVRADPRLNPLIHFFPNFQSTYLTIDTFNPPLDNKDFRQALAHAIDRDTLTQQVFAGTETTGHEMLPPGFPGYTDENKDAQIYDLEKAQASLAASGIDPASVKLKLYSQNATRDRWMTFIQQQWLTNLGVDSEIIQNQPTWATDRPAHTMQVDLGTYEYDFVDPSNLLSGLFHSIPAPEGKSEPWGSIRHPWKSEEFDALIDAADVETDVEKRIQMYQDAQKILIEDIGVIFLAHQVVFQIWWPWVVGFLPNKAGNVIYNWLGDAMFHGYIHKDVDALKAQYR